MAKMDGEATVKALVYVYRECVLLYGPQMSSYDKHNPTSGIQYLPVKPEQTSCLILLTSSKGWHDGKSEGE